jgi:small subunit ribosomal protein S16
MAAVIRLKRMGMKKKPFYRLVVTDSRRAVVGKFIEAIGYYDPRKHPTLVNINEEKALAWLRKGAKPSDTVRNLFRKEGLLKKFKERGDEGAD